MHMTMLFLTQMWHTSSGTQAWSSLWQVTNVKELIIDKLFSYWELSLCFTTFLITHLITSTNHIMFSFSV